MAYVQFGVIYSLKKCTLYKGLYYNKEGSPVYDFHGSVKA